MSSPIKVLVVDDSAFMRKMISQMLDKPDIDVVATARNGKDALNKLKLYNPEVITLDVEMPRMDGLEFLEQLVEREMLPVIMLSALTDDNNQTTLEALELGAVDFVLKPSGNISLDINAVENELLKKVRAVADCQFEDNCYQSQNLNNHKGARRIVTNNSSAAKFSEKKELVVIGASTGGPKALKEVITQLDGDLDVGVLVVQHMPANFTTTLAKRLDNLSALAVKEAQSGDRIKPGKVLLAPGDYHMLVGQNGKVKLEQSAKKHNVRPAIDLTMKTAAQHFGSKVVGVVLTGMGKDGTEGLEAIQSAGGYTIAQDKATSVVYGMPRAAYEAGVVDQVEPLAQISQAIMKLTNN
ncbi:MAG: protein-glutamate methylesterase/protein-glutamine glutaminase [Bacillota bacterium]